MGRGNKIWFVASGSHDHEYFYRMTATDLERFFIIVLNYRGYACAMIEHTYAIQVLPEPLMDHFDTLTTQ